MENLQTSSYVASLSTENNFQMLSSLKDPSLIFGLTSRERLMDDKDSTESVETDPPLETITTRQTEGMAESTKEVPTSTAVPVSCSMSVETLVSRSITASKHVPPLNNYSDTPSKRYEYFPCRSYGDDTYSVSNITSTNITTLSLIRDPGLIKNDDQANHTNVTTSIGNNKTDSMIESTKPSYTGSVGFNQVCSTSSIHSHGPREELKEQQTSNGDIIKINTTSSEPHSTGLSTGHSISSYTSPKSSTTTTFNTKLYLSHSESLSTNNESISRNLNNEGNNENQCKDLSPKADSEKSNDDKKEDEADKSSVMFARQSSTLIPKHSRPSIPSLPVGVAHPYQYGSLVTASTGKNTWCCWRL